MGILRINGMEKVRHGLVSESGLRQIQVSLNLPCAAETSGKVAGHRECNRPSRILASPGLIPAPLTWTST